MREDEFKNQLKRLKNQFGQTTYSDERIALIWQELYAESIIWFTKTIDRFLNDFRQAPLMPDFREALAKERERNYFERKKEKEEEEFYDSSASLEEEKNHIQFILKRMAGGVSDNDWNAFNKMLVNVTQKGKENGRN